VVAIVGKHPSLTFGHFGHYYVRAISRSRHPIRDSSSSSFEGLWAECSLESASRLVVRAFINGYEPRGGNKAELLTPRVASLDTSVAREET
jgi:hypothetical protein